MATRKKQPRNKRSRLPVSYRPSEEEEFMNPRQLEYFRQKLLSWRAELLADTTDTLRHLKEESLLKPDLTDRASLETERSNELRTRERLGARTARNSAQQRPQKIVRRPSSTGLPDTREICGLQRSVPLRDG